MLSVSVVRLFPLSDPATYLSVRDGDSKEVGILVDPVELDADSRPLVTEDLERRYLVPVVRRIVNVRERFGTLDWQVETDRGNVTFTTRNLRENLVQPAPDRFLLTCVDGNRYDVRDVDALDATSQGFVARHL